MRLHLASAVLCSNSTATCPADICQEVYDRAAPCCPGCGGRSCEPLTRWVAATNTPRFLIEERRRKAITLCDVVEEGGSTDGERTVASATP